MPKIKLIQGYTYQGVTAFLKEHAKKSWKRKQKYSRLNKRYNVLYENIIFNTMSEIDV